MPESQDRTAQVWIVQDRTAQVWIVQALLMGLHYLCMPPSHGIPLTRCTCVAPTRTVGQKPVAPSRFHRGPDDLSQVLDFHFPGGLRQGQQVWQRQEV